MANCKNCINSYSHISENGKQYRCSLSAKRSIQCMFGDWCFFKPSVFIFSKGEKQMRKFYCDRCGDEIALNENGNLDNSIPADGGELRLELSERLIKYCKKTPKDSANVVSSDGWRDIHLCKKCTETFYDFLNNTNAKFSEK